MLERGEMPIYEPGLDTLVAKNVKQQRLHFTTELGPAIQRALAVFIAVGTPPREDGSADLSYVMEVAESIADNLNGYKVVVTKSTVPIGTGQMIEKIIRGRTNGAHPFSVVSNPEFLREGSAIDDFMRPDRVVIGARDAQAIAIMKDIYSPLYLIETPFVITNVESSELIKYASNAFLATKITFINEVAELCERLGADVHHVAKGMGLDNRIGPKFLHPGPGYGGSCFPKDTQALTEIARKAGRPFDIVETVVAGQREGQAALGRQGARGTRRLGRGHAPSPCSGCRSSPRPTTCASRPRSRLVEALVAEGADGAGLRPGRGEQRPRGASGLCGLLRRFLRRRRRAPTRWSSSPSGTSSGRWTSPRSVRPCANRSWSTCATSTSRKRCASRASPTTVWGAPRPTCPEGRKEDGIRRETPSMSDETLDAVRLDIWLDVACVYKTRSQAQTACKNGRVEVNGHRGTAHRLVRPGDELRISLAGGRRRILKVAGLAATSIPKAEARALYEDLTPPPTAEEIELRKLQRLAAPPRRAPGSGAPKKKERRDLRRIKEELE